MEKTKLTKLLASAAIVGALATSNINANDTCPKYEDMQRELGIKNLKPMDLNTMLPNCYKSLIFDEGNLRTLAGIYAGTVKVDKTSKGYRASGGYSQLRNPEAMLQVLVDADINKDKIVTSREIYNLEKIIYPKYAKKLNDKTKVKEFPNNKIAYLTGEKPSMKVGESQMVGIADASGNSNYFIEESQWPKGGFLTSYPLKIMGDNDNNAYTERIGCIGEGKGEVLVKFGSEYNHFQINCEPKEVIKKTSSGIKDLMEKKSASLKDLMKARSNYYKNLMDANSKSLRNLMN